MLKIAFGGRICWVEDIGHIVWADCAEKCTFEELQTAVAYDITGVYYDYKRLWPVEYLGETIVDFLHNDKDVYVSADFKDWCDFLDISGCYALTVIWSVTEMCEILHCYERGMDLVETAYSEWAKHTRKFQELFRLKKNASWYPPHLGLDETLAYLHKSAAGTTEVIEAMTAF